MKPKRILLAGFVFHLLAAFFSVGYHQCDELFQVFEFAGYKLGINSTDEMPWEFAAQMRSGIQPLIVFLITKLLLVVSVQNPFSVAMLLRLLMATCSFFALKTFLLFAEEEFDTAKEKKWLWWFGLLFWCIPYFHARASSENLSATLFLFSAVLVLKALKVQRAAWRFLGSGLLAGMAFNCRFQLGFMVAGFLLWLWYVQKTRGWNLVAYKAGLLLALGLGALSDRWLYGSWTFSSWNYLYQNFFENKASNYGESPVYFYFAEALLQLIPPFSLLILLALVGFWFRFRTHYLTWITLPFVALHFFVAHKELRFLFPLLNFIPVMVLLFYRQLPETQTLKKLATHTWLVKSAIAVNVLLLLFFTFKPADDTSKQLERIYALVKGPAPVLYYEDTNPYNNQASLHYFRNPEIKTEQLLPLNSQALAGNAYLYSEKFNEPDTLQRNGKTFVRIYRNFPAWVSYTNFNGWLERAGAYSIYKGL